MFVTDDECDKALAFLRDQAPEAGRLRAAMERANHERRIERAKIILEVDGPVTVRESKALTSNAYKQALEGLSNATADYETMRLLIRAAEMKVEVWRSLNSRMNRGNV